MRFRGAGIAGAVALGLAVAGIPGLATAQRALAGSLPQAYELPADGKGDPKDLTADNWNVYDPSWSPAVTTCTVPNLKGETLAQATKNLTKASCRLGSVTGPKTRRVTRKIVSQSPKARQEEPAGTRVNVRLS